MGAIGHFASIFAHVKWVPCVLLLYFPTQFFKIESQIVSLFDKVTCNLMHFLITVPMKVTKNYYMQATSEGQTGGKNQNLFRNDSIQIIALSSYGISIPVNVIVLYSE